MTSNAYVKDNAGNKTDCGTTLVQIDKTRPYSPYICGVSGTYNISSISYACTCTSLSLIGGGGTYDKCNGRVDCKITIYKMKKILLISTRFEKPITVPTY